MHSENPGSIAAVHLEFIAAFQIANLPIIEVRVTVNYTIIKADYTGLCPKLLHSAFPCGHH